MQIPVCRELKARKNRKGERKMKSNNTKLLARIQEDIEIFGQDTEVFCWFQHIEDEGMILFDYSLEMEGKCIDPETLGNLREILE